MKTRYALLSVLLAAHISPAGTHVWSGAGANKLWSNAANWSSGGVPAANEAAPVIVEIPNSVTGGITNNIAGLKVDSLRLLGSGQLIRTGNGGSLTLRGGHAATNVYCAGVNYLDTAVSLEGTNRIIAPVSFNFLGVVSGSGGIETEGAVAFGGSSANTFTGPTIVKSGNLTLDNESLTGFVAIPGDLIIQEGRVALGNSEEIADTAVVTIETGGVLDLNGYNESLGSLIMAGGTVETDAGTLIVEGNVSATASSSIAGKLSLGGTTRTFDVALNRTLTVSAAIGGGSGINNAGLWKFGAGTLVLSGANSFIGNVSVNEGTLDVRHLSGLGASLFGGTFVSSNATIAILDGLNIASEVLTLTSAKLRCNGTGAWIGPMALHGDCKLQSVAVGQELALTGPLSGSGGFECIGAGKVLIAGTNSNTFSGEAKLSNGSLWLAKSGGAIAIPGNLTIGGNSGTNNAHVVYCAEQNQFGPNSVVTILPSGQLLLNSGATTVGGLVLEGGEVSTSLATLILNGGVSVLPSSQQSKIAGKLSLGTLQRTFDVAGGGTYPALEVAAAISGSSQGGIHKSGGGTLWLGANNTYAGTTTIAEGEIVIAHRHALGDDSVLNPGNGTSVQTGGMLSLFLANTAVMERLWLAGSGALTNGAVYTMGNGVTLGGLVTLTTNAFINVPGANMLLVTNAVSGAGGLTKIGTGTLRFGGYPLNSYAGDTDVLDGTIALAKPDGFTSIPGRLIVGRIGTGSATVRWEADDQVTNHDTVWTWNSGTLDLNGHTEYVMQIQTFGDILLGNGDLIVGGGSTVGDVTGTGRLRKIGDGRLFLAQPVHYTGETWVEGGTLCPAAGMSSSYIRLSPGVELTGQNSLNAVIASGASIDPGLFTFTAEQMQMDSLTMTNGSTLHVQLRGIVPEADYDQLAVDGLVKLRDTELKVQMGFPGAPNTAYVLIANAGGDAVDGTFAGKPEGGSFNVAGAQFQITYQGGDGNDVVLTQLTAATNDFAARLYIDPVAGTNEVRVSWPTFLADYQLQRCTNMAAGFWQTTFGQKVVSNDFFHQTFTATNDCLMFRLMRDNN